MLASCGAWLVYGFVQTRRAVKLRATMSAMSRAKRTILGPALLVLGAVLLLGGVALTASVHGLQDGSLTPLAWIIITATGLAFVHAQVLASLMMVSLATENEPA